MSRKQKLAENYGKQMYKQHGWQWGESREAFLAGYAACEQDAKVMEEALEKLSTYCICEVSIDSSCGKPHKCLAGIALAKWKERGE